MFSRFPTGLTRGMNLEENRRLSGTANKLLFLPEMADLLEEDVVGAGAGAPDRLLSSSLVVLIGAARTRFFRSSCC